MKVKLIWGLTDQISWLVSAGWENFCPYIEWCHTRVEHYLVFFTCAKFAKFCNGVEVWQVFLQNFPWHFWVQPLITFFMDIGGQGCLSICIPALQGGFVLGPPLLEVFGQAHVAFCPSICGEYSRLVYNTILVAGPRQWAVSFLWGLAVTGCLRPGGWVQNTFQHLRVVGGYSSAHVW